MIVSHKTSNEKGFDRIICLFESFLYKVMLTTQAPRDRSLAVDTHRFFLLALIISLKYLLFHVFKPYITSTELYDHSDKFLLRILQTWCSIFEIKLWLKYN